MNRTLQDFTRQNTICKTGDFSINEAWPCYANRHDLPLHHRNRKSSNKWNNVRTWKSRSQEAARRDEKHESPHVQGTGMYRADGWEPPDRRHLPARQKKAAGWAAIKLSKVVQNKGIFLDRSWTITLFRSTHPPRQEVVGLAVLGDEVLTALLA